ncbi:MAG: phosphoadenylyl-sulfate reductase [Bacteroidia bacterium]|nr:phosphoadenylyl-sulfate reductase [Bacteroidia bacterium]
MSQQPTSQKRTFSAEEVKALSDSYRMLMPHERVQKLYQDFETRDIMLTSSFAATSAFLLKLFSDVNKAQEIFFIDTGFHFPETEAYRTYLSFLYDLNVVAIKADEDKHAFTVQDETWKKNPDFCCSINKVEPLQRIKDKYSIWVSGLMAWQSDHRSSLDIFEERGGILKFYPLLDVTREERELFILNHKLPFHPLVNKGYSSIGCTHCTVPGDDRTGRWNNNPKTECGLHL